MEKRLEDSIEKAIYTLQEWSGNLDKYRLERRMKSNGGDGFYDIKTLTRTMMELNLVKKEYESIILTQKGWDFKGFSDIRHEAYLEQEAKEIEQKNLKLINENLELQNSSQNRKAELDQLKIENLQLKNRQLKRNVLYSVIAFTAGVTITNLSKIITFLASFFE